MSEYEIITDVSGVERYSFSKLSSIRICPYMHRLGYIDGVEGRNNGFALTGSLVHSILERHLKGRLEQFEMSAAFLEEFDGAVPDGVVLKLGGGYSKDLTAAYREQCVNFLNEFTGFEGYVIESIEENFALLMKLKDKRIILNGFIDLILSDGAGDYYIIDWKSKSKFKSERELREYARQLFLYSIYVNHKYGKYPKELQFVQFRINHVETIGFTEEKLNETLEWAYETAEMIEQEQLYLPVILTKRGTKKENDDTAFFCRNLCDYGQDSDICGFYKSNETG